MAVRTFATQTNIVYSKGVVAALTAPEPPPVPNNQPADEKALGFPQACAFRVEHSSTPLTDFTKEVEMLPRFKLAGVVVNGNQPADEKALGFPQALGFQVNHSNAPLNSFTREVDEKTQP